jgi:nucleoid-associated protein YgaU
MGCVQQAVLEFDEEVRAPWRPRLVEGGDAPATVHPMRLNPSRRSPSRVGVCRPPERPVTPARRDTVGAVTVRPPGARRVDQPFPARRGTSGAPTSARLRLTRRARRLAVVLALAVGVALGSWLGPLLGGGDELRLAGESSVVVQSGDTLWSIAGEIERDGDVRGLIDRIQELNGLSDAVLVPGQILRLP